MLEFDELLCAVLHTALLRLEGTKVRLGSTDEVLDLTDVAVKGPDNRGKFFFEYIKCQAISGVDKARLGFEFLVSYVLVRVQILDKEAQSCRYGSRWYPIE